MLSRKHTKKEDLIMRKLLTAVMALSVSLHAFAAPTPNPDLFNQWKATTRNTVVPAPNSDAGAVYSSNLYIIDPTKPIDFTFVFSQTNKNFTIQVATLYDNNTLSGWTSIFGKVGDSNNESGWAVLTDLSNPVRDSTNFFTNPQSGSITVTYNIPTGPSNPPDSSVVYGTEPGKPVEIVLLLVVDEKVCNCGADRYYYNKRDWFRANSDYGNSDHVVTFFDYVDGKALIGFEDTYQYPYNMTGSQYRNFDDFVILASNVGPTPIPEPETWAMLLAGLGIVGVTARRRRNK